MQTILGANGQIADELAKELKKKYSTDIRLVSRNPRTVNDSDVLVAANLLDYKQTSIGVKGSDIAYLTVGVPMSTKLWQQEFPTIMRNAINACIEHRTRLVFFDNTYMYPQDGVPLTEETRFQPVGPKGQIRAQIATMLLDAMSRGKIQAVICRAPEFYGPAKTRSITNSQVFEKIKKGKKPKVLLRDDTLRTLIWTPDASKAMALVGNTSDAYNETWHLPCDDNRLTYKGIIQYASSICRRELPYKIVTRGSLKLASLFNKRVKEILELLPRYEQDNLFVSDKFKKRFPQFEITSYKEGVRMMLDNNR